MNIRFSRFKAELAIYNYYIFKYLINRTFNYKVIITLFTLITLKYRANNSIHVNLENFIKNIKLEITSYNVKALKNIKKKLLNKYYKSYYI